MSTASKNLLSRNKLSITLRKLGQHPDNSILEIDTLVEYCDQFGTYSCKRVLLDYVRDPISSFRVSHEWDCSSMSIYKQSPEIAVKNRADNATWLYPCITPEQEQENEEIRQRAAEAERKALQ